MLPSEQIGQFLRHQNTMLEQMRKSYIAEAETFSWRRPMQDAYPIPPLKVWERIIRPPQGLMLVRAEVFRDYRSMDNAIALLFGASTDRIEVGTSDGYESFIAKLILLGCNPDQDLLSKYGRFGTV